jgi:hypothetical protein
VQEILGASTSIEVHQPPKALSTMPPDLEAAAVIEKTEAVP